MIVWHAPRRRKEIGGFMLGCTYGKIFKVTVAGGSTRRG